MTNESPDVACSIIAHRFRDNTSPFADALQSQFAASHIDMACPYLGSWTLALLTRSSRWRLLTDLDELVANLSQNGRNTFANIVQSNPAKLRNCPGLHAKTAITKHAVLLGSANFTTLGLRYRQELAAIIREPNAVRQAREWYDAVWSEADPVNEENVALACRSAPPRESRSGERANPRQGLPPLCRGMPELPSPLRRKGVSRALHDEESFIAALRHHARVSREFLSTLWEWAGEALALHPNASLDNRLITTTIRSVNRTSRISFNARYIIAQRNWVRGVVALILSNDDAVWLSKTHPAVILRQEHFEGLGTLPVLIDVTWPLSHVVANELKPRWLRAAQAEATRPNGSPVSRRDSSHSPVLFRVCTDLEHRERILDRIFAS